MKRVRGRRLALLLTSVLPLLADHHDAGGEQPASAASKAAADATSTATPAETPERSSRSSPEWSIPLQDFGSPPQQTHPQKQHHAFNYDGVLPLVLRVPWRNETCWETESPALREEAASILVVEVNENDEADDRVDGEGPKVDDSKETEPETPQGAPSSANATETMESRSRIEEEPQNTTTGTRTVAAAAATAATTSNENTTRSSTTIEKEEDDVATTTTTTAKGSSGGTPIVVAVDYASKNAGALVLEKSNNFKGTSNLLNSDRDKYAIVPCEEPIKSLVIGLSEDILVKQIALANYERYSSHVKTFNIQGSTDMGNWVDLGTYTTSTTTTTTKTKTSGAQEQQQQQQQQQHASGAASKGKKTFDLKEPSWARYLKFQFLEHSGVEYYCTISQISVHGSTMLQGFHEQWEEEAVEEKEASASASASVPSNTEAEKETTAVSAGEQDENVDEVGNAESSINSSYDEESASLQESSSDKPPSATTMQCFTQLNAVCPTQQDFQESMLLFQNSNRSKHVLTTMSSASICISSRDPSLTQNVSEGRWRKQQQGRHRPLSRLALLRAKSQPADEKRLMIMDKRKTMEQQQHQKNDSSLLESLTESVVVKQIQTLIKTTTGLDVGAVGADGLSKENTTGAAEQQEVHSTPVANVVEKGPEEKVPGTTAVEDVVPATTVDENENSVPADKTALASVSVSKDDPVSRELTKTEKKEDTEKSKEPAEDRAETRRQQPPEEKKEEAAPSQPLNTIHSMDDSMSRLLERLPSSSCLTQLDDFNGFKTKILNARANGGHAGAPPGMEPIFKKLTDEIKSLQASVAVHDMYAKESILCYQRILLDLMIEMESTRIFQDARISKLERDAERGAQIISAIVDFLSSMYQWVAQRAHSCFKTVMRVWTTRRLWSGELLERAQDMAAYVTVRWIFPCISWLLRSFGSHFLVAGPVAWPLAEIPETATSSAVTSTVALWITPIVNTVAHGMLRCTQWAFAAVAPYVLVPGPVAWPLKLSDADSVH